MTQMELFTDELPGSQAEASQPSRPNLGDQSEPSGQDGSELSHPGKDS